MPRLLSGSTLRKGGSGEFLNLREAMPQLPPSETTATGFTLITDSLFRTFYRSSLGFIEFNTATMYSSLQEGTIRILATGTTFLSTSTMSGTLVVTGGVGIGANMHVEKDIVVNKLTIGKGWEGKNNIVVQGTATVRTNDFNEGQNSIVIGYDSLQQLQNSFKTIAIGVESLSSGTNLRESIAIGDSSLRKLGTVDFVQVATITDITLRPSNPISLVTNESPLRIVSVGHNLNAGDQIYVTGVEGITTSSLYTGEYSLVNSQTLYVSVIDPNTVEVYYNSSFTVAVNATSATVYVSGGTIFKPTIITLIPGERLLPEMAVTVNGVVGTTELNDNNYYVKKLTTTTYAAFLDPIFETPLDGTGLTAYVSSGTLRYILPRKGNVAYGGNAGESLIEGTDNIFIGQNAAQALSTGSNNIFIGHNKAFDIFTGSGIISVGGDNIVNGLNNQINIGSVYYYNGSNLNEIRSSQTRIGLGLNSTGTNKGALQVLGGVGITGDTYIGESVQVLGTGTSTISTDILGTGDVTFKKSFTVDGNEDINLIPEGAEILIATQIGGEITILSSDQGTMDNINIGSSLPAPGKFTTVMVTNTSNSVSTTTGALIVDGGAGIQGDVYSNSGNPDQDYLLYTPRITVSAGIPPVDPRIGDFWIDSTVPAYLQYIKDGTNLIWIQVGAV